MLTGTPLDLTPWGAVLRGIGWLYWLLVIVLLIVAIWKPRRIWVKALGVAAVLGILVVPILKSGYERYLEQQAFVARRDAASAHYELRCKESGEWIERRVHGVAGVYLMKVRPRLVDWHGQYTPDDVYGSDLGGDEYIQSFLRVTEGATLDPERAALYSRGYAWVEAEDPANKELRRYRLVIKTTHVRTESEWAQAKDNSNNPNVGRDVYGQIVVSDPIATRTARYGVDYADISTKEDRDHWVAGGVMRVLDLQTSRVIAQRTGFLWDHLMGSTGGSRLVWSWAQAHGPSCPEIDRRRSSADFTWRVAEPIPLGGQK
jgi:hypothetical protein